MSTFRSKSAINLDEIERQIREASAKSASSAPPLEDPLAELARIVGGEPVPQRDGAADLARFARPAPPAEPTLRQPTVVNPAQPRSPAAQAPPQDRLARAPAIAPLPAAVAPKPPLFSERRETPPRATGNDDIERLMRFSDNTPPAAKDGDDLESAMRSLDDLLRARTAAVAVDQSIARASGAFDEWPLRRDASDGGIEIPEQLEFDGSALTPHVQTTASRGPAQPHERWPGSALGDEEPLEDPPELRERANRKPLIVAAAVLGVAAIGIGGALSMRGASIGSSSGQPPMIAAYEGPSKIAPANPGGIEIPDQNKQVLERTPSVPKAPARVVNSEEQPLDLREAVRRETGAVSSSSDPKPRMVATIPIPPSQQQTATDASPVAPAMPSVSAEPRRVRTVAVKPPEPAPAAAPPAPLVAVAPRPEPSAVTQPSPIPVNPAPVAQAPASTPPPLPLAGANATAAAPTTPKQKIQGSMPTSKETTATVKSPPAPRAGKPTQGTEPLQITPPEREAPSQPSHQQMAAAGPSAQGVSAAQPSEPPAERSAASIGSFAIQLSSEGSDQEARAAIGRMQSRFSELSPLSASVQQREVKGKMRYRVRFGSMSRDDATSLCSALKGKGQDCIIQPN
ncbi:MAG: SPOR domain-containing protein [Beijerinckiaceae bacterium]